MHINWDLTPNAANIMSFVFVFFKSEQTKIFALIPRNRLKYDMMSILSQLLETKVQADNHINNKEKMANSLERAMIHVPSAKVNRVNNLVKMITILNSIVQKKETAS